MNQKKQFYNMRINNDLLLRKNIGVYIKTARKNKSLSGKQLGDLLNLSQQQISRYENAVTSINIETLNVILIILEKDWFDFLDYIMKKEM
ncbi:helix-turn-helix domain-containing protein [Proteus hauseri]|uniref:helix-turn-helix domain-containing protein n=1 Tax=Proteus hauseri TaxID=183417 RepID=UPI001FC90E09|nr:helix-turn-helix transcriptional regulator [Proteus hauseri]